MEKEILGTCYQKEILCNNINIKYIGNDSETKFLWFEL